jgi:Mn2+/Fe2+ NRAMP family transporter
MDISMTFLGQAILVWMVIAMTITFLLAKRKTESPNVTMLLSFVLCFIPPFSLIFIIVLALKKDIVKNKVNA